MLRSVGNSILLKSSIFEGIKFDGFHGLCLDSATSSLAIAIQLAKSLSQTEDPEVILPAYGCPDLISACVYAGVRAKLVDIERDSPNYQIEELEKAITSRTIALVAVNFLGIKESLVRLRKIADSHKLFLVEDDAQWFPEFDNKQSRFVGDMACLSFGKGKPVSLLGGGQVFIKSELLTDSINNNLIKSYGVFKSKSTLSWLFYTKAFFYNLVIKPIFYRFFYYIFKNRIGITRYHQLQSIFEMDATRKKLLLANIDKYKNMRQDITRRFKSGIKPNSDWINLPEILEQQTGRLLRYPVLAKDLTIRNRTLSALNEKGLGATAMYIKPLSQIEGIPEGSFEIFSESNAKSFSDRLITLPVHEGVTDKHIDAILETFNSSG